MGDFNRRVLLLAGIGALTIAAGPAYAERRRPRRAQWRDSILTRRRENLKRFETDRRGQTVVRAQVIAINPGSSGIAAMRRLGFRRLQHWRMPELRLETIVLIAPARYTAEEALAVLRTADPDGSYELNHLFDPSEGEVGTPVQMNSTQRVDGRGLQIGMIDGGVMTSHPSLSAGAIRQKGFAGAAVASAHGTAVASLMIGKSANFSGYAPGADLSAADVFGDDIEGGSAQAVAAALNWLVAEGARVINISLEGPANQLVELACAAAALRGVLIVAAVGNTGPGKPVAFPAAYPSVIAATAVDTGGRVYLMANRGPEVAFAAPGVGIKAAVDDGDFEGLSGTSFAAPMVSCELAAALRDTGDPKTALARLAAQAQDAGEPGRDQVYGYGILI